MPKRGLPGPLPEDRGGVQAILGLMSLPFTPARASLPGSSEDQRRAARDVPSRHEQRAPLAVRRGEALARARRFWHTDAPCLEALPEGAPVWVSGRAPSLAHPSRSGRETRCDGGVKFEPFGPPRYQAARCLVEPRPALRRAGQVEREGGAFLGVAANRHGTAVRLDDGAHDGQP